MIYTNDLNYINNSPHIFLLQNNSQIEEKTTLNNIDDKLNEDQLNDWNDDTLNLFLDGDNSPNTNEQNVIHLNQKKRKLSQEQDVSNTRISLCSETDQQSISSTSSNLTSKITSSYQEPIKDHSILKKFKLKSRKPNKNEISRNNCVEIQKIIQNLLDTEEKCETDKLLRYKILEKFKNKNFTEGALIAHTYEGKPCKNSCYILWNKLKDKLVLPEKLKYKKNFSERCENFKKAMKKIHENKTVFENKKNLIISIINESNLPQSEFNLVRAHITKDCKDGCTQKLEELSKSLIMGEKLVKSKYKMWKTEECQLLTEKIKNLIENKVTFSTQKNLIADIANCIDSRNLQGVYKHLNNKKRCPNGCTNKFTQVKKLLNKDSK